MSNQTIEHEGEDEEEDEEDDLLDERERLIALLDAKGGRDVDLAERIDEINRELGESEDEDEND